MSRYPLSWYIFTFTLLELIIQTHLTLYDSSHGFSKTPRYYFVDGPASSLHVDLPTGSKRVDNALKAQMKFVPSSLNFDYKPLGVPHMEKVTLCNFDNKSIDLTSISGNTVHFHSSFFEDKIIPPMGNTTFNVVFLGREEGLVESNLFIHTSEGNLKYNVKGASTFSHYRLRPIVGIKLPLNSLFSPLIYMHNPHNEPIQIEEIYSSGGDFHLELPSGEQEGPNDMWEIPPQHTKAIIRVRFQAKVVQNHTAYVRIKLHKPNEILVVPLEVEVISTAGVFHPQGSVDFGIGGSLDPAKSTKLCIHNPLRKPIKIHSIYTSSEAIKIHNDNVKIMPEVKTDRKANSCVDVGTLTLNWQKAYQTRDFSGKIVVKFRNGKERSEIPYFVTVLKGALSYNPLSTTFFINDKRSNIASRNFKMKNDFLSPVQILNVTIPDDAQSLFLIDQFNPVVLAPQDETTIFRISLRNSVQLAGLKVNSVILLSTNLSDIQVPLLSYGGKLDVHLPFKSKDYSLDLGLVSFESRKEVYFLVRNHNPVEIRLKSIKSSIPMTTAEFAGCGQANYKTALYHVTFMNFSKCSTLQPDYYAFVKLTIQTSLTEGQIWGDVVIETKFENLSIPVHFKVAPGKLEIGPDRLVFDQCFPGKICSHPLRVHSTFNDPMVIEDIISLPPDKRIRSEHSGHILARATKVIGQLFLDPNQECHNECYTGLQADSTAQWLKTFNNAKTMCEFDVNLVNVFYNRYVNLTSNGLKKWQNLTLRLDTSEVRGHIFKTRVKMSWPSLLLEPNTENRSLINFPLTQVGNTTYKNITIRNPSSYNLIVQLVLDKDYPNLEALYDGLPSNFIQFVPTVNNRFFFVEKERFLEEFGMEVAEGTVPLLLLPGQNLSVTVGFKGVDSGENSALLFVRNNLTILEVLRLRGQSAQPMFKFGNRRPGSSQPLLFEMLESPCKKDKLTVNPVPIRRSYTAKNIGDITIFVNSFFINDFPCEGYGFKVMDCMPFMLAPNASKKIDIDFTPDLSLSKVTRMLVLGTSLSFPVNYTLYTTVPSHFLSTCSEVITRPYWEVYLSYLAISIMPILFAFIIGLAVLDAGRVKVQVFGGFVAPSSGTIQPVFDLRAVGQQVREETRTLKLEAEQQKAKLLEKPPEKTCILEPDPIEEPAKPKIEPEKYSIVVPVTGGRTKKKLSKKNSNEVSPQIERFDMQKKPSEVVTPPKPVRVKHQEPVKPAPEEGKAPVSLDKKKPSQTAKKPTKNTIVPAYEEETSSTTTEGSSNNEDPDKENQSQAPITPPMHPKICSKKSSNNTIKFEATKPEEPIVVHQKLDRKKSLPKTNPNKATSDNVKPNNPHKKSGNKAGKDRKSQQHRKSFNTSKSNGDVSSASLRVSPPIPTTSNSVWGETRAKFSDVVARSDNIRPLVPPPPTHSKPTMYVEPYKHTSTQELGPIGSRRLDYWNESAITHNSQRNFISNNSFFTDCESWSQQNFVNGLESTSCTDNVGSSSLEDSWKQNPFDSNAFWNSNFASLLPEPVETQRPPYIPWNSSIIWQPLVTGTPTRAPPGYDEFVQRKREEQSQSAAPPERDTYSPFNTTNIWKNQQSTDSWTSYNGQ